MLSSLNLATWIVRYNDSTNKIKHKYLYAPKKWKCLKYGSKEDHIEINVSLLFMIVTKLANIVQLECWFYIIE